MPGYDYSQAGAYFITICVEGRLPLFGDVVNGLMLLNAAGEMVCAVWDELPRRFPGILADEMIVMPDHLNGVIFLGTDPANPAVHLLGEIVRDPKGITTTKYSAKARTGEWPRFDGFLWQHRYIDRILRNDRELSDAYAYIEANPARWEERRRNHP